MENFEQEFKQEKNLEKDKQEFLDAISQVEINEISTEYDELASSQLLSDIQKTNLFILGEMHGVKENVDVIYSLFKNFGFRNLALEWEPKMEAIAERFLDEKELDFQAIQDSPDGRITAGHFALLQKLRSEKLLDQLICFDGSVSPSWNERDEVMALGILNGINKNKTLVVAGNHHAKTEVILFEDEPGEHIPMGKIIKDSIPDVPSGNIEYQSGQFYNYGVKDFGNENAKNVTRSKFYLDANKKYKFKLINAHAATVPNQHERLTN